MELAYEWTTDDVQGIMALGTIVVIVALVLAYLASRRRAEIRLKVAQETTKQEEAKQRAAEANYGTAATNLKAAELRAQTPQDHS